MQGFCKAATRKIPIDIKLMNHLGAEGRKNNAEIVAYIKELQFIWHQSNL